MFVAFESREITTGCKRPSAALSIFFVSVLLVLIGGCVGPFASKDKPSEVCLSIEAEQNLNSFDGEPHVVVVSFYPLQNRLGFDNTDDDDLLNGVEPPGNTGDHWDRTVYPGGTLDLDGTTLPRDTLFVGILADFYHGPSREVVEADCGLYGNAKLILTSRDLQRD